MPVSGVVPGEEGVAKCPRILDATEAIREVGTVFEGLELRLGIRVVIGDVWPAVGLGNLQVNQQGSHGLGSHAGTAIGVQVRRPGAMPCSATVSAISFSASSAVSRWAIIQPTT